jgi:steroid delta-isomerase-like uncharacterized protein
MSAETKGIARRFFEEAFNSGNLDVVDELASPEFVNHDAALPEPTVGIEAAKASIRAYREAFPDLRISIELQVAEGEYVTTRWSGRGTHQGDLMGMSATGKQATVTGITIDRIVDGLFVESWTNWDTLGLLVQLGAVPSLAATA